ncbi:hypothetical protein ACFY0N_36770 [Streptomyces vinaceus]|uniref:hypothetical protein n=1 Tax=Streptomyces vinaceus TaxID=1960 RepID=UPI0036738D0A
MLRVGLVGVEHLSRAAVQSCFAGTAGNGHPGQGVHGSGALVGGEVVDRGAQVVGDGFGGTAEPADRGSQPDFGRLCPVPPPFAHPRDGRRVGVGSGDFGGGEDQGGADDRVLLGGEPGAEERTDCSVGVCGDGQCVGGADAYRRIGVAEPGLQESDVGGDRGPGGGDRPASSR